MNWTGRPGPEDLDDFKRRVHEQIREVQHRHRLELEPLIKILCDIKACEPPEPIILDMSQLTDQQKAYWLQRIKDSGVIDE